MHSEGNLLELVSRWLDDVGRRHREDRTDRAPALAHRLAQWLGGSYADAGGLDELLWRFYVDDGHGRGTAGDAVALAEARLKSMTCRSAVTPEGCYLKFLKDYSSYSPLLPMASNRHHGGGYFASLLGYGLVIDPGHGFLNNFYAANHTIADVDGIVVTHFHDDHFADLPALLSLLRARERQRPASEPQRKAGLLFDPETSAAFATTIDDGPFCLMPMTDAGQFLLKDDAGYIRAAVTKLPMRHGRREGFGLCIAIDERNASLIITSDTRWCPEVKAAYEALHLTDGAARPGPVLVAHISTAQRSELLTIVGEMSPMDTNHLGMVGVRNAALATGASLVILSEVGEELKAHVTDVARLLTSTHDTPIECYAATNGSVVHFFRNGRARWTPGRGGDVAGSPPE
ncbi:MAG: MBL fold metallo-hydrolase [Armatimonadetes bacterium]|nr:MBL fold metallo-hydrolase [Armatimonadota bacterium]